MELPAELGRYTLLELLGEGGMGRVYRAELNGPAGFRKTVALKVLRTPGKGEQGLGHEARIGGLLKHPNVVDHYDFGEADGKLFIVMEHVQGAALNTLLHDGPLPAGAWRDLAGQLCAGLSHVHDLRTTGPGLVHRDLKPANVLIDRAGLVKLADFGIAMLGQGLVPEGVWGTPGYMAPEQLSREGIDHRADLFSLGVILYEAATGLRLMDGSGDERALRTLTIDRWVGHRGTLARADAAIPGVSTPLRACLRSDPEERPASADELWAMLRDLPIPLDDGAPTLAALAARRAGAVPTPLPPPPRSRGTVTRGRIPSEADGFFGRKRELEALDEALHDARAVTLKGAGGAGKSRLALRAGRRLQNRFPGGVWWCDLEEATTAPGVAVAVARGLGTSLPGDDTSQDQLLDALAALGPALLVLDAAEGAVDVLSALAREWLSRAPDLRLLVTSRLVLHLPGERILEVGPLTAPSAARLLEARAAARGADWKGDPTVAALADALDRLPLALELAAGRAGMLGPSQILDRLEDRFKVLKGSRTLRAAIEGSWEGLAPWEQAALTQLSVFRGGFRLEHAEEVVDLDPWPDAPWVLDVVQRLWETSLLRSRSVRGQPRFAMFESVRAFAAERLADEGDVDAARARHAACFVWLDEGHWAQSARRIPLAEVALELDNLVAAFEHALATGEDDAAAHLAMASTHLVVHTSPTQRALARTNEVLARHPSPLLRARLHASRGLVHQTSQRWTEAVADFETAIEAYRSLGEPWREGAAQNNMGSCLRHLGRRDEGHAAYLRALDVARRIGDPGLEGATELNLAVDEAHDLPSCRARFGRAVALRERLGPDRDWSIDAVLRNNFAVLDLALGDFEGARAHFEQSWELCQDQRLRMQGISVQLGLARCALLLGGDPGPHFIQAERLARPEGLQPERAKIAVEQALQALRSGDLAAADAHVARSLELLGTREARRRRAQLDALRGEIRVRRGQHDAGDALLDAAEDTLEALGDHDQDLAAIRARRGLLALSRGDVEEARVWRDAARETSSHDVFAVLDLAELDRHLG